MNKTSRISLSLLPEQSQIIKKNTSTLLSLKIPLFSIINRNIANGTTTTTTTTKINIKSSKMKTQAKKSDKENNLYGPTVTLPQTEFGLRANSTKKEPEIQKYWQENKIYEEMLKNENKPIFSLHDGPPYANGELHIGHALNKILKDFINKYKLMRGFRARFVPGWDTHGLPIELKVIKNIKKSELEGMTPLDLRKRAKEFALETVNKQKVQFMRYGVWGDWDKPYLTLEPKYEAVQLKVFGEMVNKGYIYRGRKPVHWSVWTRTALAEAELEYPDDHVSRSVYVAFEIIEGNDVIDNETLLTIWTTTPWTILANRAIAINPELMYSIVVNTSDNKKYIIAKELIPKLKDKLGLNFEEISNIEGKALEGITYKHPLFPEKIQKVVIGGDYITTESGTGLVHIAPGHGQEDYIVGLKYDLEIFSPVDDTGKFTNEVGRFEGLNIFKEGTEAIIQELSENGNLIKEEAYGHKYPYDWRTNKPVIFRATDQWFASVSGFKELALEEIKNTNWIPSTGMNRISSMTKGRNDWCISRQRKWGLPIPSFFYKDSKEALMTKETIDYIIKLVEKHGSDIWWTLPIEDLLPDHLKYLAPKLIKGEDTMDVWFDSGSSWAAVLEETSDMNYPADLYLEGNDQHRGWFQSSLLTSVALNDKSPYQSVLTHGFVLDENGRKMSKSIGNIIDPRKVIEGGNNNKKEPAYGADVLRLWASSVDYTSDVTIGELTLKQTSEVYRKIRTTIRFLLGNISDFDRDENGILYEDLPSIDKYTLFKLYEVMSECEQAYDLYQFSKVFCSIRDFMTTFLSAFYFDAAKDRLYIKETNSMERRSCQTVLEILFRGLISTVAPILPHLAEDAWQNRKLNFKYKLTESIFGSGWYNKNEIWKIEEPIINTWNSILDLRELVLIALEKARVSKYIGSSLEANITLYIENLDLIESFISNNSNKVDDLRYYFIVSSVTIKNDKLINSEYMAEAKIQGLGYVIASVEKAKGQKCARCWNYSEKVGNDVEFDDLCERCLPIVQNLEFKKPSVMSAP